MRFASLALAVGALALPLAAHADLLGDTVNVVYAYPDNGTTYLDLGSVIVPGGGSASTIATYQVTPTQVIITDIVSQSFTQSQFNGFEFSDVSKDPGISAVTLDAASTFTGALIDFTSSSFAFNFSGLSAFSGQTAIFDLSFAPPSSVTPEPSSILLLGTGLLGAAGVMRRRFAR